MMEGKEKDKFILGTVKVGEKGQIVIPKQARDILNIVPGDTLLVLVNNSSKNGNKEKGLALMKSSLLFDMIGDAADVLKEE